MECFPYFPVAIFTSFLWFGGCQNAVPPLTNVIKCHGNKVSMKFVYYKTYFTCYKGVFVIRNVILLF